MNEYDGASMGTLGIIPVIVILALGLLMIVSMWKIFTKAGRSGICSIIPIYNGWVLFEIAGLKGWYILLSLIPFVGSIIGLVFTIMCYLRLAKAFGKETGFAVGMIILPFVFFPLLAFGNNEYSNPNGDFTSGTPTPMPTSTMGEAPVQNQNTMEPTMSEPVMPTSEPMGAPTPMEPQNPEGPGNNNNQF